MLGEVHKSNVSTLPARFEDHLEVYYEPLTDNDWRLNVRKSIPASAYADHR